MTSDAKAPHGNSALANAGAKPTAPSERVMGQLLEAGAKPDAEARSPPRAAVPG